MVRQRALEVFVYVVAPKTHNLLGSDDSQFVGCWNYAPVMSKVNTLKHSQVVTVTLPS